MFQKLQTAVENAPALGVFNAAWATVLRALFVLTLALALSQSLLANPAQNGTVVTVTNDSGAGSLRQAILNANTSNAPVTISFNLPGSAPFIINLLSPLPAITNTVVIDGTTQPGYAGTPVVELNGTIAGANANGLYLTGGNSTVTGLAIGGFNGAGIVLDVTGGNVITANYIGTDTTGTANLGNGNAGIFVNAGDGNWIGGNNPNTGNVIAFNGGAGVAVLSSVNNLARGNSIFANAGLVIDLGATGSVVANDDGDADSGPNNLQNYPMLTSVSATGSATTIRGNFNSTSNTTFQLDFYSSPTLNGSGDAKTYLGSIGVTTDNNGNASFHPTFPLTVPMNSFVNATATDPSGNTSEFSPSVQFVPSNIVNLSLNISGASNVIVGNQFVLTLTLSNSGSNTANNVVLTDLLPASLNYAYSVGTLGVAANTSNTIIWTVGCIPAGGAATLTIYATAQTTGSVINSASFTQNEFNVSGSQSSSLPIDVFVPTAPVINSQPPNLITALLGTVLDLLVDVTGHSAVSYQWRLNGKNIPGATNANYHVGGLLSSDAGTYTCLAQDAYGVSITQPILVTISGILSPTPGDNFANRANVGLLQGLGLGLVRDVCNNINATSEPGEPMHAGVPGGKSVWYTWTSPASLPLLGGGTGVMTISTAGSSFDTLLAIYTGNNLTNLTPVASDDDTGGFYTSQVKFNVTPSTTYNIAIDGAYGASGQIVMTLTYDSGAGVIPVITTQPVNQIVAPSSPASFSVAASGSGLHYQWKFNDTAIPGATTTSLLVKNVSASSVGLYSVCVSNSAGSVMSRYASLQTSVLDGNVNTNTLSLDKFQTAYTVEQIALGLLNLNLSQVRVSSLDTRPTDGGGTSRGYSSTQVFSTYGGGTQSSEPISCNNMGGNSAWTSIQAADNGVLTIDTIGSSFNTILAVYTGNANDFSSLTEIACNIGGAPNGTNSKVSFAATSNTVYYIAVDGVNGAHGSVVLNWNLAVPPAITAQPASQTVTPGTTVTLVASASGHAPPISQWWHNGVQLPGATNGTLVISNFQSSKVGTYVMIATNSVGAAITTPAAILLNNSLHLDSFNFNRATHACQMRLVGVTNTSYVIQASGDMHNWTNVATNVPSTGLWNFSDPVSTNVTQRYYRAVPGH